MGSNSIQICILSCSCVLAGCGSVTSSNSNDGGSSVSAHGGAPAKPSGGTSNDGGSSANLGGGTAPFLGGSTSAGGMSASAGGSTELSAGGWAFAGAGWSGGPAVGGAGVSAGGSAGSSGSLGAAGLGGSGSGGKSTAGGANSQAGGGSDEGGATEGGGVPSTGGTTGSSGGITSTGGATGCDPGHIHSEGTATCKIGAADVGNGYQYNLWSAQENAGCMTVFGDNATFRSTWSEAHDLIARVGLTWDATKTPEEIGVISADFAHTKSIQGGLAFIGVYGWMDPIIEYYIIEDWSGVRPTTLGTLMGTITIPDEGVYEVYKNLTETPDANLQQRFSVRVTPRQCGHISVSEHFAQWSALGLKLGKMIETSLLVEAMNGSSGSLEFTSGRIDVKPR